MPILLQGRNNEDLATGIDEHMIRQPLGVVAGITPFNFPRMIPSWFLPYAVAAGNCFILKPSEKVPMAYFPFSGWKESFFGDLHAQGMYAVEFYTQTKVVVERWPRTWSRVF